MATPSHDKSVDKLQAEVLQLKKAVEELQSAIKVDRAGNIVIKGKDIQITASMKLTLKGANIVEN